MMGQGVDGGKAPVESRLNVGTKKKVSAKGLNENAFKLEYKPIAVQKTLALRNYYKTLLFANSYPEEAAVVESTSVVPLAISERKIVTDEKSGLAAEKLFSSEKIVVSNIYPNPASEMAWLDYTISPLVKDAKISIYNILGSTVSEYTLDKNDVKLDISTRNMASGVYFYQLVVDGKKVATKKLLVRHQQ